MYFSLLVFHFSLNTIPPKGQPSRVFFYEQATFGMSTIQLKKYWAILVWPTPPNGGFGSIEVPRQRQVFALTPRFIRLWTRRRRHPQAGTPSRANQVKCGLILSRRGINSIFCKYKLDASLKTLSITHKFWSTLKRHLSSWNPWFSIRGFKMIDVS